MTNLPQIKSRMDYKAPEYTITDIFLDFQLDEKCTKVTATSKVIRNCSEKNTPLVLCGEQIVILSVLIDEQPWKKYTQTENELILQEVPEQFTLTLINEISPVNNTALEGLYQSGEVLCTQCEAEGFRRITYFLDRPDVLARYKTRITANKNSYPCLLSNGNRIAEGDLGNGLHWVEWHDPFPKPSYLFALVAGDFDKLEDEFISASGRKVALELYVDKGKLDRTQWAMLSLKRAMKWDEQRFNLEYDLDIFMIVAVDFFNMGAMENKGLNIFNSKLVLANTETATDTNYLDIEAVIGHEYFHNWTGNRITCRDWFQLSLKEGLTVFRDQEFSSELGSRAVTRINAVKFLRTIQFAEDASPMAHPIRPDRVIEINNFYTVTVYEKGAEVIRMMHTLLGEEQFQAGMKKYVERHDGYAVTCDDFVAAMEDASGYDLTQFRLWYSQSGTPCLEVRDHYDSDMQQYQLTIKQSTSPTQDQNEKQPLHIPVDIDLYGSKGNVIPLTYKGKSISSVLNVTQAEQIFYFDHVAEKPIIALLKDFSAPVKLDYPYDDQQILFLMHYADNAFCRWDATQMLLAKYIRWNVSNVQSGMEVMVPQCISDAFARLLSNQQRHDPALIALMLTLPTEKEMAELFTVVDPDAIHAVYLQMHRILAERLADSWLTTYMQHNEMSTTGTSAKEMSARALKNICLYYLAFTETEFADTIIDSQFQLSKNMTDTLATLSASVLADLPCSDRLLTEFENRWIEDTLVMDHWFALQACRTNQDAVKKVTILQTHRAFSLKNPNKIRSLFGTLSQRNLYRFHTADGSGYRCLADLLITLNDSNPQIASRLIEPLISYKRYDEQRQNLMKKELLRIQALPNLSNDLYEKVHNALK